MPGRNIIYRALFVQKAGKWLRLFLQTVCHTNTYLVISNLNNNTQNHMAIYREMPKNYIKSPGSIIKGSLIIK